MKETKSDRTKAYILEKVAPIFNNQGYAATSLTDVLNATGLTKGAVYGNFENKEDLAQKAFRHNLMKVLSPLQEEIHQQTSAVKRLRAITGYYREYYQVMTELGGCPILNAVNDSKGVNEALFEEATKAANSIVTKLEEIVLLGIQQGKFKKKTDAKEVSTIIFSMIEGAVFLAYLQRSPQPLVLTMDRVDELIVEIRKTKKDVVKNN